MYVLSIIQALRTHLSTDVAILLMLSLEQL